MRAARKGALFGVALVLLTVTYALAACVGDPPAVAPAAGDGSPPRPGEEGMECFSNGTCTAGLTCLSRICVLAPDSAADRDAAPADGASVVDGPDGGAAPAESGAFDAGSDGGDADAAGDASHPPTVHFAFVTSGRYSGLIPGTLDSGILNAAAECIRVARSGAVTDGGSFVAWLSDSQTDAISRLPVDGGPWRATCAPNAVVLPSAALASIMNPPSVIDCDEGGQHVVATHGVWTGSSKLGARDPGGMCSDWTDGTAAATGLTGSLSVVSDWSDEAAMLCNTQQHLYCFQVN